MNNISQNVNTKEKLVDKQEIMHFEDAATGVKFDIVFKNTLSDSFLFFELKDRNLRIPLLAIVDK